MRLIHRLAVATAALALVTAGAVYAESPYAQVVVPTDGGTIANYGTSASAGVGQAMCQPDSTAQAAIATAYAGPNGGVAYTGFTGPDGSHNCTGGSVAALATPTARPTVNTLAAGANAGTSPPAPGFIAAADSNITRGAVHWGTGTSPSAGAQVVVTYPQTFATPPAVFLTPMNAATAALNLYVTSQSTTSVTIASVNAPSASQGTNTYLVEYLLVP